MAAATFLLHPPDQQQALPAGPASTPVAEQQLKAVTLIDGTNQGHAAAVRSLSDAAPLQAAHAVDTRSVKVDMSSVGRQQQQGEGDARGPQQVTRQAQPEQRHHVTEAPGGGAAQEPTSSATGTLGQQPAAAPAPDQAEPAGVSSNAGNSAVVQALRQQQHEARQQRIQAQLAALQQAKQAQQQHARSIAPCQPIREEGGPTSPTTPGPPANARAQGPGSQAQQQQQQRSAPAAAAAVSNPEDDVPVWASKLKRAEVEQGSSYQQWCQREFYDARQHESGGWARACGCMPM